MANFIFVSPVFLLLFLMIAFPMVLQLLYLKAFLFALLVVIVAIKVFSKRNKKFLYSRLIHWTFFLVSVTVFFSLRGHLSDAPGALKQAQIYGMWPIIYVFLIAGTINLKILNGFHKTIIFSSIFISIYGLVVVLTELKALPQLIDFNEFLTNEDELRIGLNEGFIGLSFAGINSFPFVIPYIMASIFYSKNYLGINRYYLWLPLFLGLIVVTISSRRALYMIFMLTPLIIAFFYSFTPIVKSHNTIKAIAKFTLFIVILLFMMFTLVNLFYKVDSSIIMADFINGFDFYASSELDASALVRGQQYDSLIDGWLQHPFFGAGHGAGASFIRNEEMPWAYELYYIALLYHTGLVGFLAYSSGVIWIYWTGIRIIRFGGIYAQLMFPTLVGLSGVLIASATNPYLVRFDGLWAIFLPVAIINSWFLQNNTSIKNNKLS